MNETLTVESELTSAIAGGADGRYWMNKAQCAAFLGVKPRTLERFMAEGKVPFVRLTQKTVRFYGPDVIAGLRERGNY